MAGRKPLPTKLKMLKGTAQKCRVNPKESELFPVLPEQHTGRGECNRCPTYRLPFPACQSRPLRFAAAKVEH